MLFTAATSWMPTPQEVREIREADIRKRIEKIIKRLK